MPRHVRVSSSKIIENLFNPNRERQSINPVRTYTRAHTHARISDSV